MNDGGTWWDAIDLGPHSVRRRHEPLGRKTTMRVGGEARYYAEPATIEDVTKLSKAAREAGVEVFLLGRGSNLIVMDTGFDGLVIRLVGPYWRKVDVIGGSIHARAGASLKQICGAAARAGFEGFEFLEGIPGTLGGSLRMNAGAMGGWLFDLVESVICLEADGQVVEHPADFFHTGYRSCPELTNRLALAANLRTGTVREPPEIREKIDAYARIRKESQPREPSAGCIFRNPPGGYAGQIIEKLGLKGTRIGGAEVSTIHANFIVNKGEATARDIIGLIREIRTRVDEEEGVSLEPEALLLGAKWEDVL